MLDRVARGVADIGFLGTDLLAEQKQTAAASICRFDDLGVKTGELVLAAPKNQVKSYRAILESGAASQIYPVATKYAANLVNFVEESDYPLKAVESDSVESDSRLGLADLVFDFRDTGETLRRCGFGIVEVFRSVSLCLVSNRRSWQLFESMQDSYEQMAAGRYVGEGLGAPEFSVPRGILR